MVVKLLSIGLSGTTGNIKEMLEHDCRTLAQEGFRVVIEELERGGYKFLGLNISEGELSFRNYERIKTVLKTSVSQVLADWIINNEEHRLINKIVANNYFYFNQDERAAVESNVVRALAGSCDRYKLVLTRILDYLENHHELVLEGFLNFRLKDYRSQLSEVIDKVVDDFMMELEYKEFIRVLRYFVDVQEPREEEAHVIIKDRNVFKFFDSHGKAIKNQCFEDSLLQNSNEDGYENLNYEDLLISALITIAPRNIMVHSTNRQRDKDLLDTIKSVFAGRVILCEGCEMCSQEHNGKSNHTEI
ncbi:putative sporulation protein YtxC [Sporomusa acidovorans]|uniref:YtxC-like family protein n=1 Tax=Sporomusa acidovorans (strain ATCC 49682 / DSM 3132 / Mol) TaxID=1123286 RepID=A0ABZ3J4G3_SPOA4|nr:putative sporulation protein YtxC [Sporomusa acidovorans]OZC20926.1 YtxC-like family protein [Sporomusa acidovorans DSM 3132]SDE61173.1 putative sporulation protein YtxC [Sporomusa acidovorans]